MLSRSPQQNTQPEIESHAAYQFYTQINSVLPEITTFTKKRIFVFHDEFTEARKTLFALKNLLDKYKKQLLKEESARTQYAVPAFLYKLNKSANEKLEKTIKDYESIVKDEEIEKNKLKTEKDSLVEDLQLAEARLATRFREVIDEDTNKYHALMENRTTLVRERKDIEAKIDKKCCGSFPWGRNKEGRALRAVEDQLKSLDVEMQILSGRKDEYDGEKMKVAKIESDLALVKQKIMSHTVESPRRIREAEERVRQAKIECARTDIQIKKDQVRNNASVSAQTMGCIVSAYDLFLKLKSELDSVKLNGNVSFVKDRLDELMQQIWSPDKENKFANTVYLESRGDGIEVRKSSHNVNVI